MLFRSVRIFVYDIDPLSLTYEQALAEYVHVLPLSAAEANNRHTPVSELLALSATRYLILQRDSRGLGGDAGTLLYKRIVEVEDEILRGAEREDFADRRVAVVGLGRAEGKHMNVFRQSLLVGQREGIDVIDKDAHVPAGITVLAVLSERRLQTGDEPLAIRRDAQAFHAAVVVPTGISAELEPPVR